jgi:hypothetical protein
MTPSTKAQATEAGLTKFFTGNPCKRGHVSERYTSTGACAECLGVRQADPGLTRAFKEQEDRFRARFNAEHEAHMARRAELKLAMLDLHLSPAGKADLRRRLLEADIGYKHTVVTLRAEARAQVDALRVSHAIPAPIDDKEHRAALADLKRSTRRVESALLAFHTKSSLFAQSSASKRSSDAYVRQRLYEEVQLQVKHARKVAESDPNGTNWTRAFHEHHAAGVQLAIERVLPWMIDSQGGMPNTVEVKNSLDRLRALRDKRAKAERIMRGRMPDPVVFPALLFEDVGEIRDVRRFDAAFNQVMQKLDAEVPQIEQKLSEDEIVIEQIKALTSRTSPRMEWK